jgi:hypothetical protein
MQGRAVALGRTALPTAGALADGGQARGWEMSAAAVRTSAFPCV